MWAQRLVRPGVFRAAYVTGPSPDDLSPGQTLLRVRAGAICGSDLPYFAGETCIHIDDRCPAAANLPGFPLHEVVGEVLATDDPGLPIGCTAVGWATQFSALADLTVTDGDGLMRVPDGLDPVEALTLQPLACVIETIHGLLPVEGLRVAVMGLGPFGLLFCHVLADAGASHVVGIDRVDRSGVAHDFGVDEFVHSATARWAHQMGDSVRPHLVIEAIGHQTASVADAIEAVADDGRVFCFGVPDEAVYPFPMQLLFRKHVTLSAGIVSERRRGLEAALRYLRRFPDLHQQLVSHTFTFAEAQAAFELAARPQSGRLKVQLVR